MVQLELVRLVEIDNATLGVLLIDGWPTYNTLEKSWQDNKQLISCIPGGEYQCRYMKSPRYGMSVKILDVADREHILFHAGNTTADTLGCILLGNMFGRIAGKPAVLNSAQTVKKFNMKFTPTTQINLTIVPLP